MKKIAHEAPKSLFSFVKNRTDIDYFLVHLFETDPEYFALAKESVKQGREVILDNSIFELGKAFDSKRFAYWIKQLEPTWYIVPDVLEDMEGTKESMELWIRDYSHLPGKKIGVIQGKTYEELRKCYVFMDRVAEVDMIAISFDYSYYRSSAPHPNQAVSWMLGRIKLLGDFWRDSIISTCKKHHLLGCALPQEGLYYGDYEWIYSIDTSNPIVHGLRGIRYQENAGLGGKLSQKLVDLIEAIPTPEEVSIIRDNLGEFYRYWNKHPYEPFHIGSYGS